MAEISKEYGTALFMLACEKEAQKEFNDALDIVTSVLHENPEYTEFLSSPGVSMEERLSAIEQAFSSLPEDVVSYLRLLCERGRIGCFREATEEYKRLLAASEHISYAKVTSAVALTDGEKAALAEKLESLCHSSISMEFALDPSLIGGVIVEIDGRILDGSVRHHLNEVKDVISR
ncbi:MAG: ATP synthase F1 subunit delta [Clostridia bacterium]|nr:ATP synthase F1 subunit delta [Clostridia bacterium]